MQNYAKGQPMGNNQLPLYDCPPAVKGIARYVSENATVSSVITVGANTTALEIGTGGTAAVMRWVATSDTEASIVAIAGATANFDHIIPANTVRRFVIPVEVNASAEAYGSAVGTNIANGLFRRVAWKTQGIASVLLTEYGSSNSY